jgi:hypothetical protein
MKDPEPGMSSRTCLAASTFAGLLVSGGSEDNIDITLINWNNAVRTDKYQWDRKMLTMLVTDCTGDHRSEAFSKPYSSSPGACCVRKKSGSRSGWRG